jgi:GNAT superfamily N-acetyltransferase
MTQILPVSGGNCLKKFIDFPHELYRDDPNYVPELYVAQRDLLTPGKHPFHRHAEVQLFLAFDGDRVTGRIAAVINHNHNAFNGTSDGFFGFFDCINDAATAVGLVEAAARWVKARGATTLIGPASFSTNETCGLLVSGYDLPPVVMMPYNAPYYLELLEGAGLGKKVDLLAYRVTRENYNDKAKRMLGLLEERLRRSDIIIRRIDLRNFREEAARLREVYNAAWDKNLGFVAMTPEEFDYLAKDLKLILNPDFCLVAEIKGKVVGFALGIPDINQVLIRVKRGRLFPAGLPKLLLGRKKIDGIRVLALGVLEGYRKLGIEACLYGHIIRNGEKANLRWAECSWMLESNYLMNRAVEQINGVPYKKYRILEKSLAAELGS